MTGRLCVHTPTGMVVRVPPVTALSPTLDLPPDHGVWVDPGRDDGRPMYVLRGELVPLEEALSQGA